MVPGRKESAEPEEGHLPGAETFSRQNEPVPGTPHKAKGTYNLTLIACILNFLSVFPIDYPIESPRTRELVLVF